MQLTDKFLITVLNELNVNTRELISLNQEKIIPLNNYSEFLIRQLYIGGTNKFEFLNYVTSFYSDQIEIADFLLNNENLFDYEPVLSEQNYNINDFVMKNSYKEFLTIEKYLNSFRNGFSLNFNFYSNVNLFLNSRVLIESENSLIYLNSNKRRLEFYLQNELITWIGFNNFYNSTKVNKFVIRIKQNNSYLSLNDSEGSLHVTISDESSNSNSYFKCNFNYDVKVIAYNYLDDNQTEENANNLACKNTICFMNEIVSFKVKLEVNLNC